MRKTEYPRLRYPDRKILEYLRVIVRSGDRAVEISVGNLPAAGRVYDDIPLLITEDSGASFRIDGSDDRLARQSLAEAEYVVIRNANPATNDLEQLLGAVTAQMHDDARLILVSYSRAWKRVIESLSGTPEAPINWLRLKEVENVSRLAGLERVSAQGRILLPMNLFGLGYLVNRFLAPLAVLGRLTLANIHVLSKTSAKRQAPEGRSVSVIVPARNEMGTIEEVVLRIPKMGPADELIFIEGHSKDETWKRIQEVKARYESTHRIKISQQDGEGKADAVRKGFSMAENEILMILDGDLTVLPEELPLFYQAITTGRGEFINGNRLVYPMDRYAMRFLNKLGNKAFALGFSWMLSQRIEDTLCGTKVLSRRNYERVAKHRHAFGAFDPFGDFDLILGAARIGLHIVEVPVHYKGRTYGDSNIKRWRHGLILFRILFRAAMRLKFV